MTSSVNSNTLPSVTQSATQYFSNFRIGFNPSRVSYVALAILAVSALPTTEAFSLQSVMDVCLPVIGVTCHVFNSFLRKNSNELDCQLIWDYLEERRRNGN
jgi:hypothetical protein